MATQKNCTPDFPEARPEIKPKGGRPAKAKEEKKKLVSVYFTDKEREKITENAVKGSVSVIKQSYQVKNRKTGKIYGRRL